MGINMNQFFKVSLTLLLFIFVAGKVSAQKFTTHAVKKGETLEGIAKQYRVDAKTILKLNKEVKRSDDLKVNTILVIPKDNKAKAVAAQSTRKVEGSTTAVRTVKYEDDEEQEEPIGFTSYRVKKKETLYSIAKRFHITEEAIKKYNPELYSSQLKRKMTLKIPKYRRVKPDEEVVVDENDFDTYTVAPKETRWSIAYKYGITVDSMVALNPELSKSNDYLAVGQELKLPKIAGSSVDNQETQLFNSYTVPAKMNFFQLEQKFGVKSDEIVRLNPEITERGGLKEGMIIRIPEKKANSGVINTDNYNFYEVKPKQTEFALTRKFGITYKELLALNPDLAQGLKAGMILKLPKEQEGNFEVRNSLVLDKINLLDSINVGNRPKLMFLLPFRLDKLDLSDKDRVANIIDKRNSLKYSLGLYSGALVAIDSIADLGISVDVKTFDNQLNLEKTKEILGKENLSGYGAIIGPLDMPSMKETALRASGKQVSLVAPIPAKSDLSLSNVFYSYTSDEVLRNRMIDYVQSKRNAEQHIIIIADAKHKNVKEQLLLSFPGADTLKVTQEEKNIGINIEMLTELLSLETDNWVFVETDNFKLVSSVSSILNSMNTKEVKVRMFTTNKNNAFDNDVISNAHLSNIHFTYPSVYKVAGNDSFSKRYEKRFGSTPDRYAVRGFDLTYDLLLKLAYKNNLIEASKVIGETEYSGSKFDYEKEGATGYYNQSSYILTFEDLRIKMAE
ncbi:LysM peptidoglycan-binding domain-containing protein [Zobellia uliginosa]|uniref:LysM peptidoglycan-binding domain-containing protein n=1 Tax=Zobellia uliginosa TaxID=143224 RepID=UPI001C078A64|nr:LysM peptidoglycan-binding domain-containing protein [Zobellia uliginosa]MBU2946908.1 LysM peptidoglycan-binding domain-containing protein [Zobellia uliginosa]